MREHIKNVVEKALNCGNPKYRYIKYKCVSCSEEYIYGLASLDEMPVLECPLCGAKFEYKKTDDR